jgi:hypothetical protein
MAQLLRIKPMKVLIGCEESGVVRRAFAARGHDAWSCDFKPAADRSNRHIVGDIRDILNDGWDLLAVMHPPCTRLCNSGVRWLSEPPGKLNLEHYTIAEAAAYQRMNREERLAFMWDSLRKGADLFSACWNAPIKRKAIENPVMHKHAKALIRNYRDAEQHVQPWWFGDKAFKSTGLYLEGLPALKPTNKLTPPKPGTAEHKAWSQVFMARPGPRRSEIRSTFFPAMADAMADQWGGWATEEAMREAA